MPNHGFTNLVSFPSSSSHSVLFRAISADWASLNLIIYPVFVVPMPATCAYLVGSAFSRADLMCVFAALVGRNLMNRLSFTSSSRIGAVLIRMQLGSFRGCGIVVLGSCGGVLAATAAHDLARGVFSCRLSVSERRAWISSHSSAFWALKSCCSALSS